MAAIFSLDDPFDGVPVRSVPDSMDFWAQLNGCQAEPAITALPDTDRSDGTTIDLLEWTDCDGNSAVSLYRINNGGHTWPGSVRPIGNGRRSRDIVGSEVMWEFFKQHPKSRGRGLF